MKKNVREKGTKPSSPQRKVKLPSIEARFKFLVEEALDYAVFMLDSEGYVSTWNVGAERLKGYKAHEIIGRHFSCFYPKEEAERGKPEHELKEAKQKGRYHEEGWRVRKDGTHFFADVTVTALRDKKGNLIGFGKVARDMTERRKTEESLRDSERKFRAVMETAQDAIISANDQGHIIYFNPGAEKIFGWKTGEVVGRPLMVLMPEKYQTPHQHGFARYLATGEAHIIGKTIEIEGKRKDGTVFPLEISLARWDYEERVFFTAIIRDITERKQKQDELERNQELLKNVNQDLTAFGYSVSHDLQAPLRHMEGFASLLEKHSASVLDEKGREYLKIIRNAASQMSQLIRDLLSFSRMGRLEMSLKKLDLEAMVRQIQSDLQPDLKDRNISWTINPLPGVQGDPEMLRLVLMNLIGNSIKYTRPRAEARIEIGSMQGEEHETVIFVRDNGVGFDMKYADKLFGVFQRLHHADEFEGTGIGLANVRRIIQRHGGRTWAEGEEGKGATFYFSLKESETNQK